MPRSCLSKLRDIGIVALLVILVGDLLVSELKLDDAWMPHMAGSVVILVTLATVALLALHLTLDKKP